MRSRDTALLALVVLAAPGSPVGGQDKTTFTLHVTKVKRDAQSRLRIDVEAESTSVQYMLSCEETPKNNTCFMPQASKDYQAKPAASNPEYMYVYGITGDAAIFTIDGQEQKPRGKKYPTF